MENLPWLRKEDITVPTFTSLLEYFALYRYSLILGTASGH